MEIAVVALVAHVGRGTGTFRVQQRPMASRTNATRFSTSRSGEAGDVEDAAEVEPVAVVVVVTIGPFPTVVQAVSSNATGTTAASHAFHRSEMNRPTTCEPLRSQFTWPVKGIDGPFRSLTRNRAPAVTACPPDTCRYALLLEVIVTTRYQMICPGS
jgi:hypothetical protein